MTAAERAVFLPPTAFWVHDAFPFAGLVRSWGDEHNVAAFACAARKAAALEVSDGIHTDTARGTRIRGTLVHVDAAVGASETTCTFTPEPVHTVNATATIMAGR